MRVASSCAIARSGLADTAYASAIASAAGVKVFDMASL
jgi:hypothetical protein